MIQRQSQFGYAQKGTHTHTVQWQSSSEKGAKKWTNYDTVTQDQLREQYWALKRGEKDPLTISMYGQEYSVDLQDLVVNEKKHYGCQVNLRTSYKRHIRLLE